MVKQALKKIVLSRPAAQVLLPALLRLHNWSYRWSGLLSRSVEPDRLHPKHRIMNYHDWFVREIEPHWAVLDIGCGAGALAADVVKKCPNYVGIDISESNLQEARRRAPGLKFISGDATEYPFENRFDAILLSNVLEHIDRRVEFLMKIQKLAPRLLIRVPRIDRDWITPYKLERGIEYRLDPTHFIEYTPEQFEGELTEAGLKIERQFSRFGELFAVVTPTRQLP